MPADYVERYLSGEHCAWDELVENASGVLRDPDLMQQATVIAKTIMERVKANTNVIRETLMQSGAELGETGNPLSDADLKPFIDQFGPLPLALDVFYRTIGSLTLGPPQMTYDYGDVALEQVDGISLIALDFLHIEPANDMSFLLDDYEDRDGDEPFEIYLCADFLHKQDISGGQPYSIQLAPVTDRDKLDPEVLWERHGLSFVNYLRHCFTWGGFPGLDVSLLPSEESIDLNWRIAFENLDKPLQPACERLVNALRKGLVEF